MLPYTATDLVEIIRREIDDSASSPHVHGTERPGVCQLLRRRTSSWLTSLR